MFDDLTKEIKAQLYERARSPLLGTFAVAWLGWNVKAVIVLFSTMSVPEKISFWGSLYPSAWDWAFRGFLLPLGTATLFLLLYPFPARWAYHYWHLQHKKLKAVQQRIDDETPMTREEAAQLRRAALQQQADMQAQLERMGAGQRELGTQREALLKELGEIRVRVSEKDDEIRKLSEQLKNVETTQRPAATESTRERAALDQEQLHLIDSLVAKMLKEGISDVGVEIFRGLVQGGGRMKKDDLHRLLGGNRVEFDHAITQLKLAGYTDSGSTTLWLTDLGRGAAVKSGMTRQPLKTGREPGMTA